MQPLHCDLQPQVPKRPTPTHTRTTAQYRTPSRNQSHQRPSRNYLTDELPFIGGCSRLTRKTHCFALGLLPQHMSHVVPCIPMQQSCSPHVSTRVATKYHNNHAATIRRSATTGSKTPYIYAHTNHCTVQNTQQEPITRQSDPSRNRFTDELPFSAPTSFPTQAPYSPMQQSCSHYNAISSITWHTRMHLRTWQQNITTIMQPLHCDLQPQVPKHPIPTYTRTTAQCRTPSRNQSHVKGTPAATASQTSCPSSAAAAALPEKHIVSRSGFCPNTCPM